MCGFDGQCRGLESKGKILEGEDGIWKALEGTPSVWKALESESRYPESKEGIWKACVGEGKGLECKDGILAVFEHGYLRSGRLWKANMASGDKGLESSGRHGWGLKYYVHVHLCQEKTGLWKALKGDCGDLESSGRHQQCLESYIQ